MIKTIQFFLFLTSSVFADDIDGDRFGKYFNVPNNEFLFYKQQYENSNTTVSKKTYSLLILFGILSINRICELF